MPRLTPEEKQQRVKERAEERLAERRLYPRGHLGEFQQDFNSWLDLVLPTGERNLRIIQHGNVRWYKDDENAETQTYYVDLSNLTKLLGFIHALIARYNARVDALNEETSEVPAIKTLERLSSPDLPGTEGAQIACHANNKQPL